MVDLSIAMLNYQRVHFPPRFTKAKLVFCPLAEKTGDLLILCGRNVIPGILAPPKKDRKAEKHMYTI
jgi:hypothetical protein